MDVRLTMEIKTGVNKKGDIVKDSPLIFLFYIFLLVALLAVIWYYFKPAIYGWIDRIFT